MKTVTTALNNFLNAARIGIDAPMSIADGFTFTLQTGAVYNWTNYDQPITYNATTFLANGPLVQGLKYTAKVGLEVDKQQLTLAARPTDLINGAQVLAAIAAGAFDGATFQRTRVFMATPGGAVVGGVLLFQGRVATIDSVGRTMATITVCSDLVVLDYDMPHNIWSPTCIHSLYDSGCTMLKSNFATATTCGAGSTATLLKTSGASANHVQGEVAFTSGANDGILATVKSVAAGTSLTLMYPLPQAPATGDGFTVYFGCPHTQAICRSRFNNLANFRGFPYVPPPQNSFF